MAKNPTSTSLEQVSERKGFSVSDEVELAELKLRIDTAKEILKMFKVANVYVLGFIVILVIADWIILGKVTNATPADRLIDSKVVMALLGATTVQVGAIMFSISTYLFPKK